MSNRQRGAAAAACCAVLSLLAGSAAQPWHTPPPGEPAHLDASTALDGPGSRPDGGADRTPPPVALPTAPTSTTAPRLSGGAPSAAPAAAPGTPGAPSPATRPTVLPTSSVPAPRPGPAPQPERYTGRVLVKLDDSSTQAAAKLQTMANDVGVAVRAARPTATGATVLTVQGDAVRTAAALSRQAGVEYAVPERRLTAQADPDDPAYPSQWDLPAIGVPAAWQASDGTGVTVAVIDTGRLDHPDLQGRYLPGYDFISDAAYSLDGDGRDGDPRDAGDWTPYGVCDDPAARPSSWHGLHVSGTIAAIASNGLGIAGISPGARLLPLRALGRCGGSDTDITDAIVWAAGGAVPGVPANPNPAKVINLSLGGPGACTPVEQAAVDIATSRGALVVVAAGNDGRDAAGYTPANCRGVIAVAATSPGGAPASFSNWGSPITLSAPGSAIVSLGNGGGRTADPARWSVIARSGTSMATPHVSAVAALVWSLAPTLTAAQVRSALLRNLTPLAPGTSGFGAGILNAAAAVESVRPQNVPAPVIGSVDPPGARSKGGDVVTVRGSNLAGARVSVGGREATVQSATPDQLRVVVPAGTLGQTQLVVRTAGGSASAGFFYDSRYVAGRTATPLYPRS